MTRQLNREVHMDLWHKFYRNSHPEANWAIPPSQSWNVHSQVRDKVKRMQVAVGGHTQSIRVLVRERQ